MEIIIHALVPIFLLIALGYFFKRLKFPHESFWQHVDKFNYFVLFPSLLIYKLATAEVANIDGFSLIATGVITLVAISIALMVLNRVLKYDGASFTSVYQGAIRFNTYVFLALIDALLGDSGLVIAAFLITFMIPIINVFCIAVFASYVPNSKVTVISFVKSIVTNPLILACFFGGLLNFFGLRLPMVIENTLAILSSAALSLGLLSVGVGLQLSTIKEAKSELIVSLVLKLFVVPVIIMVVGNMFGLEPLYMGVLILFASMPTAPSAYVLARQLGGNLQLMSSVISIQTIISILTIAFFLQFMGS